MVLATYIAVFGLCVYISTDIDLFYVDIYTYTYFNIQLHSKRPIPTGVYFSYVEIEMYTVNIQYTPLIYTVNIHL